MRTISKLLTVFLLAGRAWGFDVYVINDTTCTVSTRWIWDNYTCPGGSTAHYVDWNMPAGTISGANQTDFGGYCIRVVPQPGHTGSSACQNYPGAAILLSTLGIDGCSTSTNGPTYTTNCWHASMYNGTGEDKSYVVMANYHTNGGYFQTEASQSHWVPRGTSTSWTICWVGTAGQQPPEYRVLVEDPITGEVSSTYDGQWSTNGGSYSSAISTNMDLYPSPISLYDGGTNHIPGASLGDNAIYSAIRDMDNHLQHMALSNSVSVVNSNYNANFNTNLTSVSITNPISITTTNNVDLNSLSNLLQQVRQNQTNDGGISGGLHYMTNIWAGTNAAIATARGVEALGDVITSAESVSSAVQAGPPISAGSGTGDGLTFAFCGTTICLDPATIFPGIPDCFRLVFSWLMIVGLLMWMGKEYLNMAVEMGRTKMGSIPDADVDVPIIGNWMGVAIALAIPVIYLGLWLTLWHFIFGTDFNLLSLVGQAHSSNPFYHIGLSSSTALYLINEFIDLNLALALFWARLTWYYVGGKIIMVLMAASRVLVGE